MVFGLAFGLDKDTHMDLAVVLAKQMDRNT